jgi:HK97 family phage major capsid protein
MFLNIKSLDLYNQARAKLEEIKAIADNPQATAGERKKMADLIVEAQEIKAHADQVAEVEKMAPDVFKEADKSRQGAAAPEPGHPGGSEFKDAGEYLRAVAKAGRRGEVDPRLAWFDDEKQVHRQGGAKDLAESVGATGGYLVPVQQLTTVMGVQAEQALIQPRATVIRMSGRSLTMPVLDQTTQSSGGAYAYFGGVTVYHVEENAEKTESDPAFRQIELVAHELIAYTRCSDALLADSGQAISDFFGSELGFAGAIAFRRDWEFLRGTGAGQPLGIVPAGATFGVGRAATGTINYADLANMYSHMLPSSLGRAEWFISVDVLSTLMQIQDTAGNYIWATMTDGPSGTLFGRPWHVTEKLPGLGTRGDVLFADCKYYLIGDRQVFTLESTPFDKWAYNQTSWRAVTRYDGQPWLSDWITTESGHEISPFVVLDVVGANS